MREVRGGFDYFECKVENIMARTPHLSTLVLKSKSRGGFWCDYEKGFTGYYCSGGGVGGGVCADPTRREALARDLSYDGGSPFAQKEFDES